MDARSHLRNKLQAKVKELLPHYIHHRNLIGKGNGEFTFLRHPIQMGLLLAIAYKQIPIWAIVGLVILYLAGCWIFGWVWDKNAGYDFETEWSNDRNPTIRKIERKV